MITDIVFFAGASAAGEPIDRFRRVHSGQFLTKSGVVPAYLPDAFPPPRYKPEDMPDLVADTAFAPLARQRLAALLHDRPAMPEVLTIQNLQLHKRPHTLALQSAFCRHFFPDVRQRAIFVASPADREIEAACSRVLIYGSPVVMPFYLREFTDEQSFLEKSLTILEEHFGKDAVTTIPYRSEEQVCREFTAALVSNIPDARESVSALSFTPSPVSVILPRDVLAFMEGVNQLFVAPGSGQQSPHPWRNFVPFLRGGARSSQLLSPETRAELKQKFDEVDIAALANRKLPPWTRQETSPDIPYEAFPGLTDDEAFRLAKLLPQEHVDVLIKGPHLSEQYQTYGARQCLRALQKAHGEHMPSTGMSFSMVAPPQPRVSVLTLSYNHAAYIGECIESVIAQQTSFPIQHIIADDGSDDGTQDIILSYAAKYPHIVPMFQKNRSRGTRNIYAMFDMARTEYVALCDGDDYFTDPSKLQSQVDLLDAHPDYALCFHMVRVVYEDGSRPERLYPPEDILPRGIRPFYYLVDLIRNNFIQTNAVMYRWRFQNGLPDWFRPDIAPADRYWHLLHAEMGKAGFINKVMSVYRRHKKGVFYLSEIDALKHRASVGRREIEVWDVINKHFNRKYESIILDMINHIFADCLLYDTRQAEEGITEEPVLNKLADKYPDFARHFLASLDRVRHE